MTKRRAVIVSPTKIEEASVARMARSVALHIA